MALSEFLSWSKLSLFWTKWVFSEIYLNGPWNGYS